MLRLRWLIFQISSQPNDEVIYGAGVCVFVKSPYIFQNLLARNYLSFAANQITQQLRLHQREAHGGALLFEPNLQ